MIPIVHDDNSRAYGAHYSRHTGIDFCSELGLKYKFKYLFRNGDQVDTNDERITIRSKWIHLNSVGTNEIGSYSCKATNDAGTAETNEKFDLVVEGKSKESSDRSKRSFWR